jgi:hypothetical protein
MVFPGRGKNGHQADTGKAWRLILERAGLKELRIHDLRRSLGSRMASTGASMVMTRLVLGQKTIAASLIYQRLAQDPVRGDASCCQRIDPSVGQKRQRWCVRTGKVELANRRHSIAEQ